jgi:hypothetical protein
VIAVLCRSGLGQVACRSGPYVCGLGTVTGHPVTSPARHSMVIPHAEGLLAPILPVSRVC